MNDFSFSSQKSLEELIALQQLILLSSGAHVPSSLSRLGFLPPGLRGLFQQPQMTPALPGLAFGSMLPLTNLETEVSPLQRFETGLGAGSLKRKQLGGNLSKVTSPRYPIKRVNKLSLASSSTASLSSLWSAYTSTTTDSTRLSSQGIGSELSIEDGNTSHQEGSVPKKRRKGPPKGKKCRFDNCGKYAQGGTRFCVSHGGGRRCESEGCTAAARAKTKFCTKHGGGKRCQQAACTKSAIGSTQFCVRHGGVSGLFFYFPLPPRHQVDMFLTSAFFVGKKVSVYRL